MAGTEGESDFCKMEGGNQDNPVELKEQGTKSLGEKIANYCTECYDQYRFFSPQQMNFINRSFEMRRELNTKDIMEFPSDLEERVDKILQGQKDIEIERLLDRHAKKLKDILSDPEKSEQKTLLIENIIKAMSYNSEVKKQSSKNIELKGMNNDNDFLSLENQLIPVFTKKLLSECLISEINYDSDTVAFMPSKITFYLPREAYYEILMHYPQASDYKIRAISMPNWNDEMFSKYASTPIMIYSFEGENIDEINYLNDLPNEKKMALYKLGTVSHEIGHHIYCFKLSLEEKQTWRQIVDSTGHMTNYSAKHSSGVHGNKMNYSEEFSESIRLITTVPDYFKTRFPEAFNFINNHFKLSSFKV